MKAVTKRPSGRVSAKLVVDLAEGGFEVGAEAQRHAQHRVHLRDRQRRRDAVPGGVAQHDQQALVDERQVVGVAAGQRCRQERARACRSRPASGMLRRQRAAAARRAPVRAPGASSRLRSAPSVMRTRASATAHCAARASARVSSLASKTPSALFSTCITPTQRAAGGRPAAGSGCSGCGSPSARSTDGVEARVGVAGPSMPGCSLARDQHPGAAAVHSCGHEGRRAGRR